MERPIGRRTLVWSLVTLPVGVYLVACGSDDDDNDTSNTGGSSNGGSSGSGGGKGGSAGTSGSGGGKGGSAGTSGAGGSATGGSAGTGGSGGGGDVTDVSSVVNDHSHSFTIMADDIDSPPAAGVTGETTLDAGHTHGVEISMAELATIGMGETVTITTTSVNMHTHEFMFMRVG